MILRPNSLQTNNSKFQYFIETSQRTKLHDLSTNVWLKTRHPETTNLNYLCFPFEREQHNIILEFFRILDENKQNCLKINELIKLISRFNNKIPRKFLWRLFHSHDYDKDDALNFEEFKCCALSIKGKSIFDKILEKIKSEKTAIQNLYLPTSFNTLITQVSYKSARNDLLKRVSDKTLGIDHRADNFFKLFGLQNKYKNPDDFHPENSKRNTTSEFNYFTKKNSFIDNNNDSLAMDSKFMKFLNESKISDENEKNIEEIEKLVSDSKLKGEEIVKNLKENDKTGEIDLFNKEKTKNIIIESEYNSEILKKKKRNNIRKIGKIDKIMIDTLKESENNKGILLFKKMMGIEDVEEKKTEKRQIKFYPIQINKKMNSSPEKTNEFELFLPKIKEIKNREAWKKKIRQMPTINIFNEELSSQLKKGRKKIK